MHCMLAAFGAEFLILDTFGMFPLVLRVSIILRLANGASKYNDVSRHNYSMIV